MFLLYALLRMKDVPRWQVLSVFGLLGVLLIPVAMRAIELNAQAKQHVVMDQPTWMGLAHLLDSL